MSDATKPRFHVRRGDDVVVISGSAKGRRGKIKRMLTKRSSVILEGADDRSKDNDDKRRLIKPVRHYLRKSQQNPQGGLLWLEGPIHVSNVMKVEEFERRQAKRGSNR
jgi:large subunit ribosomal protein L24